MSFSTVKSFFHTLPCTVCKSHDLCLLASVHHGQMLTCVSVNLDSSWLVSDEMLPLDSVALTHDLCFIGNCVLFTSDSH